MTIFARRAGRRPRFLIGGGAVSVRSRIVRLVVAVAAPLLALNALLLFRSAQNEQAAIADLAFDCAIGAAADLDRDLRALEDALVVLSSAGDSGHGDHGVARLGSEQLPRERGIALAVSNPRLGDAATGTATLSDFQPGQAGQPSVTMTMEYRDDRGQPLAASLDVMPRLRRVLADQHLARGWSVRVLDRKGAVLATTLAPSAEIFDADSIAQLTRPNGPGRLVAYDSKLNGREYIATNTMKTVHPIKHALISLRIPEPIWP